MNTPKIGFPGRAALLRPWLSWLAAAMVMAGALASKSVFADPIGTSATWYFNLPSTATSSQNPPYPLVTSLFLQQTAEGVQFTLTPDWNNPPTGRFDDQSFIERVDYVYKNDNIAHPGGLTDFTPIYPGTLANANFRWDSGAPVAGFNYETNQNNLDSGYKTNDQHINVDFVSTNNASRFDKDFSNSVWTVLNTNLSDFTGTFATSGPKPSPTQGVVSVTAYSLEDPKPTPSNWVTGPGGGGLPQGAPEPATLALVGLGLAGLFATRRRKLS